ncbi:hypothetical protein [Streptomyces hokutonensis]
MRIVLEERPEREVVPARCADTLSDTDTDTDADLLRRLLGPGPDTDR